MNTKIKKGIFWGAIIASVVFVWNVLHHLFGGTSFRGGGQHGHGSKGMGAMEHGSRGMESMGRGAGGMGAQGGFEPHHFMNGPHHGGGFSWLGTLLLLIIGIAVLVLLVKWLRRKSKASSMQQFIDTSLMSSQTPLMNQNASVLDHWEKNKTTKKEND